MMSDGSGCNCPAGRVMWLNDESGTPVAACVQVSISRPVAKQWTELWLRSMAALWLRSMTAL